MADLDIPTGGADPAAALAAKIAETKALAENGDPEAARQIEEFARAVAADGEAAPVVASPRLHSPREWAARKRRNKMARASRRRNR